MDSRTTRREFLRSAAVAGAGALAVGCGMPTYKKGTGPLIQVRRLKPDQKLNIGIVGVNHRGGSNMRSVSSQNIAALCDIDEKYLAAAKKKHPNAKTYIDWREMIEQPGLDAVVCSTADQVHAFVCVHAMRRGLHVYCEKPLAHSVSEARLVRDTYNSVKGHGVRTQMGTQIHAGNNYRRVVELVQSGAIGPVREAHVWCGRRGPGGVLPEGEDPLPENLHWDLWLGPAPYRPYNRKYMPGNMTWNRYWDFGNGTLGDMGSHLIDLPFWALKLRQPLTCEAKGEPAKASPYTNPKWLMATWEHPARGDMPPVKLTWYDGIKQPPSPEGVDLKKWHIGCMFVGDKGTLVADYGKHVLLPKAKFSGFKPPKPWIAKSRGHHNEWIHACKTGDDTLCNFDYSGMLIEHNLLGNVAYRVGKKLVWDPKHLRASNCPEADKFIRRAYRKGWTL